MIRLRFLGAARQVTGSKHLLEVGDRRVLLECGMVQGPRRISDRLNRELPVKAGEVDAVVLSHAHIDHSGSLPRLCKLGFDGPIYCTPATAELLGILLPDSAHLQAGDVRALAKRGIRVEPPYDLDDVEQALRQVRRVDYGADFAVCEGVRAHFRDAGHILGSAHVVLDVDDGRGAQRVVFTGDHGRKGLPILRDPEELPECDVLITESTYGDREHPSIAATEDALREVIADECAAGGRVLIPAFSVGRTQNVLWYLGELIHAGALPPLRIWVDSPMSSKATAIVARHPELFDRAARRVLAAGRDPFLFDGVECITDAEDSKRLNFERHGVILSASGMCEGGRILHHLEHTVGRREDCVLFVGYQAEGTLGRKLVDGYDYVKIFGERHRVRCRVRHVDGLSAHADWREMIDHLSPLARRARHVFVVHGEEGPAQRFADRLVDAGFRHVHVPVYREEFLVRP